MWRSTNGLTLVVLAAVLSRGATCFGVAWSDQIAHKGQPAYIAAGAPEGTSALANDSHRTTGWNDFFSEWCNDVNHYQFAVSSTDEINALIEKLAAVKCDVKEVRLSYRKEPQSLGWVTHLPAGNNTAVLFSIGSQAQVDQWFAQVRKPFGQIEFKACPVAVPPTLTVFVQNEAVDLEKLRIPEGINVMASYVPGPFHRWNTVDKEPAPKRAKEKLDEASQKCADHIDAFIGKREANAKPK